MELIFSGPFFLQDVDSVFSKHLKASLAPGYFDAYGFLSGACRTNIVDALVKHLYLEAKARGCEDRLV